MAVLPRLQEKNKTYVTEEESFMQEGLSSLGHPSENATVGSD